MALERIGYNYVGQAYAYTTLPSWLAVASSNDIGELMYSNTNKCTIFPNNASHLQPTISCTIRGGLPRCQATYLSYGSSASSYYIIAYGNGQTLNVENMTIFGGACAYNVTSSIINIKKCIFIRSYQANYTTYVNNSCKAFMENCLIIGGYISSNGAIGLSTGTNTSSINARHVTIMNMFRGVYSQNNGPINIYNSVVLNCYNSCFSGSVIRGSNNASDDGTGPANNLIDLRKYADRFWCSTDRFPFISSNYCKINKFSPLANNGMDVGVKEDIFGRERKTNDIGCFACDAYLSEEADNIIKGFASLTLNRLSSKKLFNETILVGDTKASIGKFVPRP